ncbi:MAG: nitroreductase [Paludibacteraceae bacterium]|nr:nitroreductase [Paludibacteraceae bacterium]
MTELEAIQARHSVRKYIDEPIKAEKVKTLQACIDKCNRMGGLHLQLITDEPIAFGNGIDLPKYGKFEGVSNYIALVAPKGSEGDELTGYYGEKVVLLAQTLGLNSCWVGLTFKKVKTAYSVAQGEELKGVIALGYGVTQGVQHPQKKTINDVAVNKSGKPFSEWFVRGIEAALLAPTAVNQQKFELFLHSDNRVEAKTKFSFIGYTHIDLGIAKCHFELAAGKENFNWK